MIRVEPTGDRRWNGRVREECVRVSDADFDEDGTHLGTLTHWEWRPVTGAKKKPIKAKRGRSSVPKGG